MSWFVGVDLGATNIAAVVGRADGSIEASERRPTPQTSGIEITEEILATVEAVSADAGISPETVKAAGIGSIGPLDMTDGVVREPANLPDAVELIPLTGPLEKLVKAPVVLHNDANAGVIAEQFYAEYTPDNIVYLTISSGIGAGVIVDGTVLRGWDGNAGEVGHFPVDPDGVMRCGCGKRGHWEAYCSGNNIPQYAQHLHEGQQTALPIESGSIDAAAVFTHAESDGFAESVLEHVSHWNARGVTAIVHAYAPMVITVGGAVALHNPHIVEELEERVADLVMTNVPEIRLTSLGNDVVVTGALASAIQSHDSASENR